MNDKILHYVNYLNQELKITTPDKSAPIVLDLFAGCGGLSLGFESLGFRTIGFEVLPDATQTYNHNLHGECHCQELQVGQNLCHKADVIIGGPPCQPFSVGGLQSGPRDSRDGFPIFLDSVERYQPQIALFENVRGMFYKNEKYLQKIIDELENIGYNVSIKLLNAFMFGVPQKRERLFVVASKYQWIWPNPLQNQRFNAGDAIGDTALNIPENPKFLTESMIEYV